MLDPDVIAIELVKNFPGDEYWIDTAAATEAIALALRSYGDARAAQYSPWLSLDDIPPGSLFETEQGIRAIKSEYRYPDGAPECILLASGEYAHFVDKGKTPVRIIVLPD
jgi:hypothetical protein